MTTTRQSFEVPSQRKWDEAEIWAQIPVALATLTGGEDAAPGGRAGAMDYACLETLGVCADDHEDWGGDPTEHITMEFQKQTQIEETGFWVWSVTDDDGTWKQAYLICAQTSEGKYRDGLNTIDEADGLTVDQAVWRMFHQNILTDPFEVEEIKLY